MILLRQRSSVIRFISAFVRCHFSRDKAVPLQSVNRVMLRPASKRLAKIVEGNGKETPQRDQRHVGHDRGHEAGLLDPRSNKLREAVAPTEV